MTLRFLKCLVLVPLVHISGAAMVFGAYHFAKAGEGLAEKEQPDGTPKTIVNQTKMKGEDSVEVRRHTVKRGEGYGVIAKQYDISIQNLRVHNGHKPSHILQIGEELLIPSND